MPLRDVEFSNEEAKSAGLCLVFPFSISRLVQAGHRSSDVSFLLNEGDLARTAAGGPSRKLLREFCKRFAPFCWLLDLQRACGSCSTAAPLKTDSLPTS
jgi:hypothetical protein